MAAGNELQRRAQKSEWNRFVEGLTPDIDPRSIRLLDELRQVAHMILQISENSLVNTGLSYAKYRLLMNLLFSEELEGRTGLNPSEISDRQGTGRNTISALIRDLEKEELIERQLDQADRRKFNIRLTSAGRMCVLEHADHHFQVIASCFGALDYSEREAFSRLLRKLNQNVYQQFKRSLA